MRATGTKAVQYVLGAAVLILVHGVDAGRAQSGARSSGAGEVRIVEAQGRVEIMPAGATTWVLTQTNQLLHAADRLRTGENSRATLLWSDQSVLPFGALTEIEIMPAQDAKALPGLQLMKGIVSFFHRDQPGRIRVITRGAVAGIEGTEFVMAVDFVDGQERATLSVIDGKVQFSNAEGVLCLTNSEQAVAEPGKPPVRTAGFVANNLLQWCFYYPAVLDLQDLHLSGDEERGLNPSLAAYRAGDLLEALRTCPSPPRSGSDAEQLYRAALLLSVGQVEQTEAILAALPATSQSEHLDRLARSLRTLIAAVKRQPTPATLNPQLSTELLAASYYEQSRAQGEASLKRALELARQAVARSPQFGFAWERVAELEFEFGHTAAALEALNRSLQLAPRNAQALALKGFLLAAQNEPRAATEWFNRAIAADSALANAWLGRGLCRIRRGDLTGGLEDLVVAAGLEPQRSLLRSYLGKAYTAKYDYHRANKELNMARELDPNDPTSWLYSALLKQQQNQINEAIGDLENSQERNDNRSVFRSRLLLDEDLAVRSANLASVYRDAGMTNVSLAEAARAVTYDYANASAHLFLSDSYNELRDPTRFNLRYETVWFNELLLANLLAPVGGGRLSQNVSQEEYSSLFQADGVGLSSSTTGRSDNQSVTEMASQFGTIGWTSYALDLDYQHNGGIEGRPNNSLDDIEWYTTVKQQVTPEDTALLLVKYEDYHSGDNFQYYNPKQARPYYQYDENQQPILMGAWTHEWGPGVRSMVMGGRFVTEQTFSDLAAPQLLLVQNSKGVLYAADLEPLDVNYHNNLEIYFAEFNQLFQWNRITLSLGARYQTGSIEAQSAFINPPLGLTTLFNNPVAQASLNEDFQRYAGYGYLTVEPLDRLYLIGGLAYDDITYPSNFRNPPLSAGTSQEDQLGPKAGLVWNPLPLFAVRGDYTRSLGGVSEEESFRLEQTQVAGFPQAFRSLIPESVVGSVGAPKYETYAAALDLKLSSRTYAGIVAQALNTDVNRTIGDLLLVNGKAPFIPSSTPEVLRYRENSIGGYINQLLGKQVVVGASYTYDQVKLRDDLPNVPAAVLASARQNDGADLQEASAYILFNHPSGFFAQAEATWYHQLNSGYTPALPGDDFVQENLYVGYRFLHRHAQVMLGVLNLSGQNYHLNPLSTYIELPRERAYTASLSFAF